MDRIRDGKGQEIVACQRILHRAASAVTFPGVLPVQKQESAREALNLVSRSHHVLCPALAFNPIVDALNCRIGGRRCAPRTPHYFLGFFAFRGARARTSMASFRTRGFEL
ncbi:MAG TPA: hypothetical protein VL358_09530 [Caulobacteraceae bacterium]|nr:hypothetical protein [Caulobacteraceae bacterium]